jgi:hypothetical protein
MPPAEEFAAHQPVGDGARLFGGDDATPEEVSGAGGQGVYPAPGAVEGEGVVAAILHPEVPIEALPEGQGLRPQLHGQAPVSPNSLRVAPRARRSADKRRRRSLGPRRELWPPRRGFRPGTARSSRGPSSHGFRGPQKSGWRRLRSCSPCLRGRGSNLAPAAPLPHLAYELHIAGPAPDLVKKDKEERGRVHTPVVRRMRGLPKKASSPSLSSCRIFPGSASRKSSLRVA